MIPPSPLLLSDDGPLPVIVVEDSEDDYFLLLARLEAARVAVTARRVEDAQGLRAALCAGPCAVVIADHRLPQFTSLDALHIVRGHDPDMPFLIVSGAIGEEVAVEAMRAGADDYLMKDKLGRLEPALRRALGTAASRRRQRAAEAALAESEARFRALSANLPGMVFQLEVDRGKLILAYVSEGSRRLFERMPQALAGDPTGWFGLFAASDQAALRALFGDVGAGPAAAAERAGATSVGAEAPGRRWMEYIATLPGPHAGTRRSIEFTARARHIAPGRVVWDGIVTDITFQQQAEAALRTSREELRELASYLARVREEERTAIARELHDDIGSTLTGIKFQLAFLKGRLAGDAAASAKVAHLDELVDGVILSSSRLMHDLRPAILDEGIVPALEWQARSFEQRAGVACTFECAHEAITLAADPSVAVFRICQEALNNVAKHASATLAHVRLAAADGVLTLEIRDDGVGIGATAQEKRGHFGLRGMRERAVALGGAVTISGSAEEGTTITLVLPLASVAARPETARVAP